MTKLDGFGGWPPASELEKSFNAIYEGARPDGTDALSALNVAIAKAAAAGGGIVHIPAGTYTIKPNTSGQRLNIGGAGVKIIGDGKGRTVLKVESGGAFDYVFYEASHDVSGLLIANLTIDMNIDNNPVADLAEIMAHPRYAVYLGSGATGSKITIENVEVRNNDSVNTIVTTAALSDVIIRGCSFINKANALAIDHDHSTLYLISTYNHVEGNYFEGDAAPEVVSNCAIETHCSHTTIAHNRFRKFAVGLNLTGVSASEDSTETVIIGNVMDQMSIGAILLWSYQYSTHTSGYGLDGVTIVGNVAHISQTVTPSGTVSYGIAIEANSDLPVRNVVIADNVLVWEKEAVDRDANSAAFGIGFYSANNMALENCQIVNNVLENMPMAGIRLSCAVVAVRVAGNILRNCGSTLHAETAAYRTPICLLTYSVQDLVIAQNVIIDDFATTRIPYALYCNTPTTGTPSGFQVLDNEINIVGATKTAYQYDYYIANAAGVFGRGRLTDGYAAPVYGQLPGTEWIDQSLRMKYIMAYANTPIQESYGVAAPVSGTWVLGSRVWNIGPSAGGAPGWVCVTAGTPGTWKAMANLAA